MSLYTLTTKDARPTVSLLPGLRIEESTNVELLSVLSNTSVEEITRRLANDHAAFIAYLNDKPAAFGWMARGKAFVGELNHELVLPYRHRYLWNFRTITLYRGMGIYPLLLQWIIAREGNNADRFWIIHAPENEPSLRGIQKAGFQYVGRLYTTGNITAMESTELSRECQEILSEMDIVISEHEPVSCWNCSSPHLKRRNDECCCETKGKECVGHNLAVLS